jgi:hypothetical protein
MAMGLRIGFTLATASAVMLAGYHWANEEGDSPMLSATVQAPYEVTELRVGVQQALAATVAQSQAADAGLPMLNAVGLAGATLVSNGASGA